MSNPFTYLTEADWAALRAHSREIQFVRDAVIVREASESPGVMVIRKGSARVEQRRDTVTMTLAHMGEGEVFGEMSLLEDTVASATVIAHEDTSVELFERGQIEALLQSDPGFSARFHRSLAVHLSKRMRDRNRNFAPVQARTEAPASRAPSTRLGQVTERQIPPALRAGLEAFKAEMNAVEARPGTDAERRIADACDRLMALMVKSTAPDALFEAGFADLGSFRDPATLASGIGAYVFRQTFSWFMSAATIARVHVKPRGLSEDHETIAMMVADDPEGDGVTGPLLDRWFLQRPVCRFRRESRKKAVALLQRVAVMPGDRVSVAILGSGTATEAIERLADPQMSKVVLTCIDLDQEALARGAKVAADLDVGSRVSSVHANAVPTGDSSSAVSFGRHEAIYALGLLEYLSDRECVRLLDWAHGALIPGGTFAFATLAADNPDRPFMEHILEWNVSHRSSQELEKLFARSRFGASPSIEASAARAGIWGEAVRPR
ncbi:MAG: cyclic nucleotide-binding domain-containing protein [Polyangiaceae bacterium]|nr:cyclic nucleotide-binding domain-containing protein [Polyangiaceae bacterium]